MKFGRDHMPQVTLLFTGTALAVCKEQYPLDCFVELSLLSCLFLWGIFFRFWTLVMQATNPLLMSLTAVMTGFFQDSIDYI